METTARDMKNTNKKSEHSEIKEFFKKLRENVRGDTQGRANKHVSGVLKEENWKMLQNKYFKI